MCRLRHVRKQWIYTNSVGGPKTKANDHLSDPKLHSHGVHFAAVSIQ